MASSCNDGLRLPPELGRLHGRIVELQREKAIADAQVSALEAMILRVNRSECDVSGSLFCAPFLNAFDAFLWLCR